MVMALWKLTPVDRNDLNWGASLVTETLIVRAPDELAARSEANNAFGLVPQHVSGTEPLVVPWLYSGLVSAEEIDDLLPKLVALEKEGNRTRLGKGLRTILNDLRGTPPSAVILLTDGITTEGEKLSSAAEYARSRGVALFPVGLGDPEPVRDMELTGLQVDDVAFVNDPITFFYTLTGRGYAGKTAMVSVREKESDAS